MTISDAERQAWQDAAARLFKSNVDRLRTAVGRLLTDSEEKAVRWIARDGDGEKVDALVKLIGDRPRQFYGSPVVAWVELYELDGSPVGVAMVKDTQNETYSVHTQVRRDGGRWHSAGQGTYGLTWWKGLEVFGQKLTQGH